MFYRRWLWTAAGARGDHGSSALGRVEVGWSSPTGSALTQCLRMEGSTVKDRGSSTSPATYSHVTTMKVRVNVIQLSNEQRKTASYIVCPLLKTSDTATNVCPTSALSIVLHLALTGSIDPG